MRLLLTGADGFTGRHLTKAAEAAGFLVCPLRADLTDAQAVLAEVAAIMPSHVIHLAAISAVTHADELAFYQVNLFGSLNLLQALAALPVMPKKVLLASSANVYGNHGSNVAIAETVCPKPVNHYAMSKLAMEHMAANFSDCLQIVIARPFNYTGVGHDVRFVVPKIVGYFQRYERTIELGNLEVYREYNDVRMVCDVYLKLLSSGVPGEVYNVCTGEPHSLQEVIALVAELSGHKINVAVNPAFVRANELHYLAGDATKLKATIGDFSGYGLRETLGWMLGSAHK